MYDAAQIIEQIEKDFWENSKKMAEGGVRVAAQA